MRIQSLHVRDFLGVYEAELDLASLTILYGSNGAGKSSLVDAIRHALTGDVVRGEVLADLVRAGAKKATIEVMVGDKRGVLVDVTAKGRSVAVDGIETSAKEVPAAIQGALGVSVEALRAALTSGALFTMKPDARFALLAALTGAKFDRATIAAALGEPTCADLARLGIEVPSSLADLRLAADTAVQKRRDAKAKRKNAEDSDAHVPVIAPDLAAKVAATTIEAVTQRLVDLQRQRDLAIVNASTDPVEHLTRRIEQIEAELPVATRLPEPSLDEPGRRMVRAETAVRDAKARVTQLESRAVPVSSRLSVAEAKAALDAAKASAAQSQKALDVARAEYTRREAIVEAVKRGGCCDSCGRPMGADLLDIAEHAVAEAKAAGIAAKDAAKDAAARVQAAEADALMAEKSAAATEAVKALSAAREAVPRAEADFRDAEKAYHETSTLLDKAKAHNAKFEERARLVAERNKASTPSAGNLTLIEAEIVELSAVRSSFKPVADHARFVRWIREATETEEAADRAEKRCLAVRDSLVRNAIEPFTTAANAALAVMAPGVVVDADLRVGGLDVSRLSDGERTRVLYALQLAATRLSGARLLVLDRVELIDDGGRQSLKKLAAACAAEGIQVVMLTCAAPPATVPAGIAAYELKAGRATQLGVKHAA